MYLLQNRSVSITTVLVSRKLCPYCKNDHKFQYSRMVIKCRDCRTANLLNSISLNKDYSFFLEKFMVCHFIYLLSSYEYFETYHRKIQLWEITISADMCCSNKYSYFVTVRIYNVYSDIVSFNIVYIIIIQQLK